MADVNDDDLLALERDAWRIVAEHLDLGEVLDALVVRSRAVLGDSVWSINRVLGDPPHLETIAESPSVAKLTATPIVLQLADAPATTLEVRADIDPDGALVHLRALVPALRVALDHDQRLHDLVRRREAVEADNRALLHRLQRQDISASIVGAETGLFEVMQRAAQVAPTEAPVLILGETGSGKEVVARAVHTQSRRANGPFLRVNCGAIPSELVDSELFGHERGSFTGAVSTRKGWFERADGGTLFLDEVAELPAAAQVRLLRVLQDGGFERVGGQQGLVADVRIVAATHRDMPAMIAKGLFREDLWYRISVFPIPLPPLRERRQDIAALTRHFAASAGSRLHGIPLVPDREAIELLSAYDWPGNVRELAAVVERATILGGGVKLDVARALGDAGASRAVVVAKPSVAASAPTTPAPSLESITRRAIEDALQRTRGRIEGDDGAAQLLGVHPATLRSRMRRLGIEWKQFRA
jgi:hydrogenase-4 transcriptional activator